MYTTSPKFVIFFLALGLFAFVVLAIFGLGHMGGMEVNKDGNMEGCIFTGETMLCKMSIIEHISWWQSIFTAVVYENLILLALLMFWVAVISVTKNILAPPRLSQNNALAHNLYLAQHPGLPLFNLLKEVFSQGILNPKIYESAHI